MSQEDADAQAESVLPPDMFTGLADSAWKVRLAAMDEMQAWLEGGEMARVESELIVRVLSKRPGWKDSNFQVRWPTDARLTMQVFAKVAAVLQLLAERSSSFSKACIALATPALCDKLGDIKLKKPAGDALIAFAEKSSLQFVLSQGAWPSAEVQLIKQLTMLSPSSRRPRLRPTRSPGSSPRFATLASRASPCAS